MLSLDKRPCKIGININTRREKHGEDKIPAKDIRIKNILLSKDELNELFGDKHAWDMLYLDTKGKPAAPFFLGTTIPIAAFPLAGKFLECKGELVFGLNQTKVEFIDAKFARMVLEPQTGGLTSLAFTLQCLNRNFSGDIGALDDFLDGDVTVELEFGALKGEDEHDEDDDQEQLDLTPGGDVSPKALAGKVKREKVDHKSRKSQPSIN